MMRLVLVCFCLCLGFASGAQAATDDVRVNQFINSDLTPPSTPTTLTATTTTHDRIYLTWGASTDNYLLQGYRVFRDAVQIATTTLTTFTDTGLAASTSYSYYVDAFDHVFNYSSSSNVAVATTTAQSLETAATSSAGTANATLTEIKLLNLVITPEITGALLSWNTNRATRYELRWGRTQSYELGFVTGHQFHTDHVTHIEGLDADTVYEYEIISYDRGGNSRVLSRGQLRTLSQSDTVAPANVAGFTASAIGRDVALSWKNPLDDFAYVRIVRNPFFYPRDPHDGYIIYQGSLEAFVDRAALESIDVIFYTAFVYDAAGNRSSGAITQIRRFGGNGDATAGGEYFATTSIGQKVFSTSSDSFTFSIDDFLILQAGEIIKPVSGTFLVDTSKEFTIQAPYQIFPEHLKTIQVRLVHPVDKADQQSFLLRINNDKTAYEATISQLRYTGTIPMEVTVFDFFTNTMTQAEGFIISTELEPSVAVVTNIASDWSFFIWWLLLLLLLLLLWWFIALRRRSEDKRPVPFR